MILAAAVWQTAESGPRTCQRRSVNGKAAPHGIGGSADYSAMQVPLSLLVERVQLVIQPEALLAYGHGAALVGAG